MGERISSVRLSSEREGLEEVAQRYVQPSHIPFKSVGQSLTRCSALSGVGSCGSDLRTVGVPEQTKDTKCDCNIGNRRGFPTHAVEQTYAEFGGFDAARIRP